MKKVLLAAASLLVLVVIALFIAWHNLPAIGSWAIAKIAGGTVEIARFDFSYKQGLLFVDMGDIRTRGDVTGEAGRLTVALDLKKGLHFNNVVLSDFTLSLGAMSRDRKDSAIIPVDLLEARNGAVTYEGNRFALRELVVQGLRRGKPFRLRCDVTKDDWFGNLTIDAEGLLSGRSERFTGTASVARMDMGRWTPDMAGVVNAQGSFVWDKEKLAVDGSFAVSGYELRIKDLKDPRFHETLRGSVHLSFEKDILGIHVKDLMFRNAPFLVDIELKNLDLTRVDVSSGPLDLREFQRRMDLEKMEKGASRVWDYVKGGQAAITKIQYVAAGGSFVDFSVKGVYGVYGGREMKDVEGSVRIDDREIRVTGLKGHSGRSSLENVSSLFTFSNGVIKARGGYSVDFRDVASEVDRNGFSLKEGTSSGTFSVEGKSGALEYRGSGSVTDGRAAWKTVPFSLKGTYTFTRDTVTFEPMQVYGDATDLTVTGFLGSRRTALRLRGSLDPGHINRLTPLPFKAGGSASIDVGIEEEGGILKAQGAVDLAGLFYEIPNVMTKAKGIANRVHFDLSRENEVFHITRLTYNLGTIDADVRGDVKKDGKMDLDVAIKIDGFEKVASIFATSETVARGDAEAVVSLKGVDLKMKKVSFVKGYVHVNNGFLRIPGFVKPFREMSLKADFAGDSFDIRMDGFKCGATVLTSGTLSVKGLESPRFSLVLDMNNLDFDDFETKSELKMMAMGREGPLAHASGSLSIRAAKVKRAILTGTNLEMRGVMADRKINISEFSVETLGGRASLQGNVDLSGTEPKLYANGKVNNIKSREVLEAFKPRTHIIKGTWLAYGAVTSYGETPDDWLKNMSGNVTLYSQDGVIKKWNFLSKALGLLNLYDLVRGKVDLSADGLAYTRMGAKFAAKEGVFKTDNFLIDSPAMLITGAGDIDLRNNEIEANIIVSPLVSIDSFIDKIPIVGRIFRKKKGGFLYVSYEVKGTIDDPEVKVSFVDTIGGKALNIIKGIFTLPKGVFE